MTIFYDTAILMAHYDIPCIMNIPNLYDSSQPLSIAYLSIGKQSKHSSTID